MQEVILTESVVRAYGQFLRERGLAHLTVEKYEAALLDFGRYLNGAPLSKSGLLGYRESLRQCYTAGTVNGRICAINGFLRFAAREELRLSLLRVQHSSFVEAENELTEADYRCLLNAALSNRRYRLWLLMQTVCSSGIRIGELRFVTVEAARRRWTEISHKGKNRRILLNTELCVRLLDYARLRGIETGSIFVSCHGNPLDRSNIWHEMKALCGQAGVNPDKVFPHNLRHLFARSFYSMEKDLSHLADIMGHSSIETTRLYVAQSMEEHERILRKMQLVV